MSMTGMPCPECCAAGSCLTREELPASITVDLPGGPYTINRADWSNYSNLCCWYQRVNVSAAWTEVKTATLKSVSDSANFLIDLYVMPSAISTDCYGYEGPPACADPVICSTYEIDISMEFKAALYLRYRPVYIDVIIFKTNVSCNGVNGQKIIVHTATTYEYKSATIVTGIFESDCNVVATSDCCKNNNLNNHFVSESTDAQAFASLAGLSSNYFTQVRAKQLTAFANGVLTFGPGSNLDCETSLATDCFDARVNPPTIPETVTVVSSDVGLPSPRTYSLTSSTYLVGCIQIEKCGVLGPLYGGGTGPRYYAYRVPASVSVTSSKCVNQDGNEVGTACFIYIGCPPQGHPSNSDQDLCCFIAVPLPQTGSYLSSLTYVHLRERTHEVTRNLTQSQTTVPYTAGQLTFGAFSWDLTITL